MLELKALLRHRATCLHVTDNFPKAEFNSSILAAVRGTILGSLKLTFITESDALFFYLVQVLISGLYCILCQTFHQIIFFHVPKAFSTYSRMIGIVFNIVLFIFCNTFKDFEISYTESGQTFANCYSKSLVMLFWAVST